MKLVAVMLLLSLALSSSHALYPVGSRVVVIRIDDIQDYDPASSSAGAQEMLLQYHIDHKVPALLAIIGSNFGKQQQLIDQIQRGVQEGFFTIAIHGWNHMPYPAMSPSLVTIMSPFAARIPPVGACRFPRFSGKLMTRIDMPLRTLARSGTDSILMCCCWVINVPRRPRVSIVPRAER